MATKPGFLRPDEEAAFAQRRRRTLRLLNMRRRTREDPVDVEEWVTTTLDELKGDGRRVLVIDVLQRDGSRWTAETAYRTLHEHVVHSRPVALAPDRRPDGLPAITDLVGGERHVRELAERRRLVSVQKAPNRIVTVLLILVVVVLGGVPLILDQIAGNLPGAFSPTLIALAVALGLGGLVTQLLMTRLNRERGNVQEQLRALFQEPPPARDKAYADLAADLAADLVASRAGRCLVIEGYSRLDWASKQAVATVLKTAPAAPGRQFWVIVESFERDVSEDATPAETLGERDIGELTRLVLQPRFRNRVRPAGDDSIAVRFLQQQLLSRAERRAVAEAVGRPDRAGFHAVGEITREADELAEDLRLRFSQYRSAHPVREQAFDALDLLFVLALRFDRGPIQREKIAGELSQERERREVIRLALRGAKGNLVDFTERFDEVRREFAIALREEAPGRIAVLEEAATVLRDGEREWQLPKPSQLHLYWALEQRDQLGDERRVEPESVRVLVRHLLAHNVADELGAVSVTIRRRVFAACAFAIDRTLKISRVADVPALLERAHAALADDDDADGAAKLRELYGLAYALLGDERTLALLLQLLGSTQAGTNGEAPSLLDRLFVESLSLPWQHSEWDARVVPRLPQLGAGAQGYARVRAIWLALVAPAPPQWPEHVVALARAGGVAELPGLVDAALARAEDRRRSLVAADLMTLSLGLWCMALVFQERVEQLASAAHMRRMVADALGDDQSELADHLLNEDVAAGEELEQSLHQVAQALQAGYTPEDDLREGLIAARARIDYDLPGDVLAQELRAVIGAAAHLVVEAATELRDALPSGLLDGGGLARDLSDLEARVTAAIEPTEPDARLALWRELNLVRFTWDRLGFEQLADHTALRSAHFWLLSGDREDERTLRIAVESLAELLDMKGFIGVMANATAAIGAADREGSAAPLVTRATELALDGELGERLCTDLSLSALECGHTHAGVDLERILAHLLAADCDRLTGCLEATPDHNLGQTALMLMNALQRQSHPEFVRITQRRLRTRAASAPPDVGHEIENRIDMFDLEADLDRGTEVVVPQVLAAWRTRGDWSLFCQVLNLLIRRPNGEAPELLDEGAKLLAEHCDGPPPSSAPIELAAHLAAAAEHRDTAVRFLEVALPPWAPHLDAEVNLDLYKLLADHAENGGRHWAEYTRWQVRVQEQFQLSRLGAMVRDGAHFGLFWHYVSTLAYLGLPLEESPGGIDAEVEETPDEVWLSRLEDLDVPPAFLSWDGVRMVSGDFLRSGRWLFSERAARTVTDKESLAEGQAAVHDAARSGLDELFDTIAALDALPDTLRQVLERHREVIDAT